MLSCRMAVGRRTSGDTPAASSTSPNGRTPRRSSERRRRAASSRVSAACSQHGSGGRCRYAAAAPGGRVHLRPEGAWPCLAARSPTPPHTQPTAHPMPTWPTSATRACSCCSSPSDSSSSRVAGMSEGNASSAAAAAPRPAPAAAVRACRRLRTGQRGQFTHSVSASMMQWPAGKAGGSDRAKRRWHTSVRQQAAPPPVPAVAPLLLQAACRRDCRSGGTLPLLCRAPRAPCWRWIAWRVAVWWWGCEGQRLGTSSIALRLAVSGDIGF